MNTINTEVCIIGAGAGGFGCLYRLIQNGIRAVIADENDGFGGTAVFGGVNCWEPGVSLDGVHRVIAQKLLAIPNAAMVAKTVPNCRLLDGTDEHSFEKYPWGLSVRADEDYDSTLKRCRLLTDSDFASHRRFQFEPDEMSRIMDELTDSPLCTKLFGHKLIAVEADGDSGRILSVTLEGADGKIQIYADSFVDSTGSIVLARMAGCATAIGSEPSSMYGEPSAPDNADMCINGVTFVFRIAKKQIGDGILDFDYPPNDERFWTVSCFNTYPNGDINVNMLPTMTGEEYLNMENADEYGADRVRRYWNFLQRQKGMSGYTLCKTFKPAIREDYRLVGQYVLTENHLLSGILNQDTSELAAVADHAMDVHGKAGRCAELDVPYGIPVKCAMTREYSNLYVACRGASFSHIAASSARLTRTMLSFGEGVGEYISETKRSGSFSNALQGRRAAEFKEQILLAAQSKNQ